MNKIFISTLAVLTLFSFTACSGFEYSLEETINQEIEKNLEEQIDELPVVEDEIINEIPVSDDTLVEEISSEEIFCMEVYAPVCGMIESICEEDLCEYVPQTFSNSCYAEKANAKNISEGACE